MKLKTKHREITEQDGKNESIEKNRFVIFSVVLFLIILVAGSTAFFFSMRTIIRANKGAELTRMLEVQQMMLESSLNSDISIILKLANSPFIKRYFADPSNAGMGGSLQQEISAFIAAIALEEISSYRQFSSEGFSIFWVNDIDKLFYMNDIAQYLLDVNSPDNYWYKMTLYDTEVYNFNINYNPDLHVTNLWINSPVFDNNLNPIGIVGSGIDLSIFIDMVYQNVGDKIELYFFNGLGEITGASDIDLVSNKVDIRKVLDDKGISTFSEAIHLKPGEIKTYDAPNGKLAIGTVPLLEWYMVAFMADSISDYNTAMTALFLVVLVLLLVIFIIFNMAISGYLKSLRETMESLKVASEAKSRFVANMNHEMRTPMNAIVGLTDLMMEEDSMSASSKETLRKINTAGNTLMGLISDVLDISKIETGKLELMPEQYGLASLLNDVITLNMIRIGEKPIIFKLDINEDIPRTLFGDDLRVKQILNNLLSNAFKYTKEGIVTLNVDFKREGSHGGLDERSDSAAGGVWVSFSIIDTGIGIREENLSKLFSNYNQVDTSTNRESDGTGLGLDITKKFVELMAGEITAESEYGKGSTFRVRIRQGFVSDAPMGIETVENLRNFRYSERKRQAQGKMKRMDLSYARVLVVDDFPTNLDVASGMLRKYKMQVDCVQSGKEAVSLIAAGTPVYTAIFMDHMMPVMDGVEATKLIRSFATDYAKNVPIIALTANAVTGSERMFLDNGFNAFLPKPFNVMNLDAVIQKWIRDKSNE